MPPTFELLAEDLRERAFALRPGVPRSRRRIGAEVELIPVSADTRLALPIQAEEGLASLPFLRRFGGLHGWKEDAAGKGPRFLLSTGGMLGYEPGGQIEYASPPLPSASALLAMLRSVVLPLRAAAREEGIELLSVGIDPHTPLERVALQLCAPRYVRMTEYLSTVGTQGTRMMRQTAAFQLSLDTEDEPLLRWRVLNAAAPVLLAIFANSPSYAGAPAGHQSVRAHVWRELDPTRTGVFGATGDAVAEYLDFALGAPVVLQRSAEGEYLPLRELVARGETTLADWHTHLSTLFPEVRPRGHLELRSLDAVDPSWYAAPVALLSGLVYHRESLRAAAELLAAPDAELLRRAGRIGLGDAEIGRQARDLFEIGMAGAAARGEEFLLDSDLEIAREFFDRYTRRGRSPADDLRMATDTRILQPAALS
ncbi:MAG TPA: glutamate-cysteine ligase family protein, partial [Longimicrobiaceae bacterium]|nr:glutamate-cysteine ligase family protein [Longimicrobiaceae bacterium]